MPTAGSSSERRGVSPVVGAVLLLAITIALAGVVAASVGAWSLDSPGPQAAFDLAVDADRAEVCVEHVGGDAIDVDDLSVTVTINGESLSNQPPVPFVGAAGFRDAPGGPFNAAADSQWTPGERATFRIARTNAPTVDEGDEVVVTLSADGRQVASLETRAI